MLNNKGLSLIEILIVLAIIGVFAFVAVPSFIRSLDTAKIKATEVELQTLRAVLNTYFTEKNTYPGTLKELVDEKFIGEEALTDGWNRPYYYSAGNRVNNSSQTYSLFSAGRDGQPDTADDLKLKMQ